MRTELRFTNGRQRKARDIETDPGAADDDEDAKRTGAAAARESAPTMVTKTEGTVIGAELDIVDIVM